MKRAAARFFLKLISIISIGLMVGVAFGADTYTSNYNLRLVDLDVEDYETPWGMKYNNNFSLVDAGLAAIAVSSGTAAADITALKVSTGAIQAALTAEIADRIAGDAALLVSTTAIYEALQSTAAALTAETEARILGDYNLGVATTTLTGDLATEISDRQLADAAVAVDTTTLGGRILANEAWISTAQPRLDNLDAYGLSTGTVFGGDISGTYDDITIVSVPPAAVDLSTVTTALDAKVDVAGDTMTGDLALPGLAATYGVSAATGVFTSTITTPYLQGGGADFTTAVTGISLSEIEDLEDSKVFTMANKTLEWQFTNPSGGMLWEFTGAAGGHSLEILQTGGNPGPDMHGLHIQMEDPDPAGMHLVPGATTSRALLVHAFGDTLSDPARWTLYGDGAMAWGDGSAAADTNLYRSEADVLKTDDSLVVVGSMTANTLYGDGSGLSGVIQSTATGNYALRVATATYLATAPGTCAAGEFINALTADGTKTCAVPAGGGDVVLASTQTFTGANTFTSNVSFNIPAGSSVTWSCPTGFTAMQSQGNQLGCIQTAENGSAGHWTAMSACFTSSGGRLPFFQEIKIAFDNYALTDETDDIEWVGDIFWTNGTDHRGMQITTTGGITYDLWSNNFAYRCFIPK